MNRSSVCNFVFSVALLFLGVPTVNGQQKAPVEIPKVFDDRLEITLFASDPDIVHPIGLDFDAKGRLLVIESHTHFAPGNYKGPKFDRIRMIEDTTGKGKADRFTTFFEGTKATMDIAVHPDGWVYLATRNEILRLYPTQKGDQAGVKERIVFLDTKGDYPHNGLSGLSFDSQGNLNFGMGENLGAFYKLIGADGTTITGEGDGGHIFSCTADGKKLRRFATGFWNPFGTCRDIYGRMFAVDNDPDAMPPCRMLHVVPGGDYGYQFRYGRQGRHPFQAWNGELPGTLPMMAGTGEAPCEILSYESDNLPAEYLGNLLVTSWADHRVERYRPKEKGASFTALREPFVQGGKNFRPVGMAVAPDGSLFVSDWVLRDYNLHGKGAIWHIRRKDAKQPEGPTAGPIGPKVALSSLRRPLREWGARQLARSDEGRDYLRSRLTDDNLRVRTASLTALIDAGDVKIDLQNIALKDEDIGIRAMAVRALALRGERALTRGDNPLLVLETLLALALKNRGDFREPFGYLKDADPFLRHAAVWRLSQSPEVLKYIDQMIRPDPLERQGLLLAHRAAGRAEDAQLLPEFLADPDEDVRFLAAKWIADEKLKDYRPLVAEAMKNPKLNVKMYMAYATALARIDGQPVNDGKLADYFFDRLTDDAAPPSMKTLALQLIPAKHPRLTLAVLQKLVEQKDAQLSLEAVRTLAEHPNGKRFAVLHKLLAGDLGDEIRDQAIVGLADKAQDHVDEFLQFTERKLDLAEESLRALIGVKLSAAQRDKLASLAAAKIELAPFASRVLGKPFFEKRPAGKEVDAWMTLLEGKADAAAGRRIFSHPKLAGCFRCHRVEGRGNEVGPDLSTIGRVERRAILESILQPSNNVAPHYQAWQIETADGQVRVGMLTNTTNDDYTYLDTKGSQFRLNTRDIVTIRPVATSIMPDGLQDQLTDQEMRDLLAYLCSRR